MAYSLIQQQIRSLNDMLSAERILRASSENAVRELRQLLLDVAMRLDGERMETIRRSDPRTPANWSIQQWQAFMEAIPAAGAWGAAQVTVSSAPAAEQHVRQLLVEIERLTRELDAAAEKLSAAETERGRLQAIFASIANPGKGASPAPDMSFIPAHIPDGAIAPWIFLSEEAKNAAQKLPRPCPQLQKTFGGGARSGGDLKKAFMRVLAVLELIGKHRLCVTMEIDSLIGEATDVKARSGSLRRVMDEMIERQLLSTETLAMSAPKTALKVVSLSKKGEALYRELFNAEPLENDWARLIRLHEGDKYVEHTLAVLAFGIHARKRGYYTCVLPDVEGNAVPDLWIGRGEESLYVEVELGNKQHETKWLNLAALNNGRVAICASVPTLRERYMGDCKLDESGRITAGAVTDLETLVKSKYLEMDHSAPLWINTW